MVRQLYILRHAKSAWDTDAASDFDRPLAKRGQKDVPLMGVWMKEQKMLPEHILSSPAVRAAQTVLGICQVLDIKEKKIHWERRIYGADTAELLEVLGEVPNNSKSVLIVGHNPGLESLASFLVGDLTEKAAKLNITAAAGEMGDYGLVKTATLLHLETELSWDTLEQRSARLRSITYPRSLYPGE
ncbi:SixA phosphatase family protein [Candidatus Magnetaquicoccus inordinatus]|uniref:SixA phosphatase family protein n=1 Tax=Candidatus Magnetaquicoccus inordinatus TaxID=2496818 RepID=UPI00102C18C0|nr:histidine phosphatase family protein [Candidatus Magnetaquicoccus inordinatus]